MQQPPGFESVNVQYIF